MKNQEDHKNSKEYKEDPKSLNSKEFKEDLRTTVLEKEHLKNIYSI